MAVDVMHLSALPNGSPRRGSSPSHHVAFSPSPSPGHKPAAEQHPRSRWQSQPRELSRSCHELSSTAISPSRSSVGGGSLSTTASSELSWNCSPEEQQALERIQQCRKQLEGEIDVSSR